MAKEEEDEEETTCARLLEKETTVFILKLTEDPEKASISGGNPVNQLFKWSFYFELF